jgi:hypothetical protein
LPEIAFKREKRVDIGLLVVVPKDATLVGLEKVVEEIPQSGTKLRGAATWTYDKRRRLER